MSRLLIIAAGTRGDVQPAIALGVALRAAGYAVRVLAGLEFAPWIARHGLEAAPSSVDMQSVMSSRGGRDWVERGHDHLAQRRLMRGLLDAFGPTLIREAWEAAQGVDAIVGSFTSDTYAVAFGEKLGIPVLSAPLQPALLATRDGRAMTSAPLPGRISRINAWFGRFVLEPFPWSLYGDHVNAFRRSIGLRPQTSRENVAARRRMTTLHGVSRCVTPRPADWPATIHVAGYWFLDEGDDWRPPPDLDAFIHDGPKPIAVGFGSMTGGDPDGLIRLVVDAVTAAGQRAVLLGGWAGIGSMQLPAMVHGLASAPHDWLFPRVAAVVHHGGAGTTAAALRAGVPGVVVPAMADQPYWGRRVHALRAGPQPIPRHQLSVERLADAIRQATTGGAMSDAAARLGAAIRAEDGPGAAVGIIQGVVRP